MRCRILLALLLLAPVTVADEDRGILLTRDAQRLIAEGRAEEAVALLEQARVEWPDSPVVAQTMADAQLAMGNFGEALAEYERGSQGGYEHRSRFNSAVTLDVMAEARLVAANVPLDPAGLPEGPQPEMLTAINEALPVLDGARGEFLRSLDESPDVALGAPPDAAARESIGAVNRRIDELREMAEELQRRQDEQEQQENQDGDEDEEQQDEDDEQQEQDQQEGDEDQEPGDQQDEDQEGQEPDEGEGEPDDQPQDGSEGEPAEPRLLSREEVQQLLEKLEELEKEGRELRKLREAARRRTVEKDW